MTHHTDQQHLDQLMLDYKAEIEGLTDDNAGDWLEDALDIEVYLRRREGETCFSHVEVLVTYGGPTVRVRWDRGEYVTLEVASMRGHIEARIASPALAAVLEQHADLHY